jgi:predicted transcriptional regulator
MSTPIKPELPILTRVESELMALFWRHGPMTVSELNELLTDRAYTSLATLVKILEQKGYLTHAEQPDARAFVYRAAVEPGPAKRKHVRDLIDRLFGGKSSELVVGLLGDEKLSRAELESLRAQIDERLRKGNRR